MIKDSPFSLRSKNVSLCENLNIARSCGAK